MPFAKLVDIVASSLPIPKLYRVPECFAALEESLRHLAGELVTEQIARDTAYRLAGNLQRLTDTYAAPPWRYQLAPEWVPVRVMAARPLYRQRSNKPVFGSLLDFEVLAGTSCPLTIRKWWSLRMCRYHARNFGFSTPRSSDGRKARIAPSR
ncbi:MAG: hypothetical protein L0312_16240, partial [Acidobacteria bacterium]|nr:hypothetical protein [Acidobacteriota bacterium]